MESIDRSNEFIWGGDLDSKVIGTVVFDILGIRTWGELANVPQSALGETSLEAPEIAQIRNLLMQRGFNVND